MKELLAELKAFLMRGNVVDMAVGIVIGAAFGKVVTSFVNDILMPPISLLLGSTNFSDLKIVLKNAVVEGTNVVAPAITWNYGNFIQIIIDFLIVGTAIFFLIKGMNQLSRKKEEAPAPAPEPTNEEKLLAEIRDLMKKEN
ncbi:MAG TPA: large-conductance mechanosensitive channel protein MscL [Paludibacteraceae bacterium]|nr:large-conductance mechanosensitive channel protein MscL [Paludibacteraceae bacterium]HOK35890.1 large-conductance mechanosensitive channel protein MscL [Paludibacteraceae bacterium]HOL00445.1 large-conductance mechanosensitive channel protein MscL [Paludibacteraceae bacterium]HPC26479.1 large-conductance mechanosensitive channel protein MscL [Paludibacteraceae bacterium]HPO67545.1 large-conductance mechanosensitive channel protein MscL [Paludibacteraceae bacterium]